MLGLLQEETPGFSFHRRLQHLKRNLREKNNCRSLFAKEAENLNSNVHGMFERESVEYVKELGCTPFKEDREAMAGEGVPITPHPSSSPVPAQESQHPTEGPPPQAQRRTGAQGQVETTN